MPLYELKSGAHFTDSRNYTVGDKLELSEETAKALSQYHQLELVEGKISKAKEVERVTTGNDVDTTDWDDVLKSSSIGKILLIVKKTDDKVTLDAILAAEEKGQNREKIVTAVKSQLAGAS